MATGNESSTFTPLKIKQEPMETNGIDVAAAQRPGRLTSFKVPRDLTLGGAGPLRTQRGNANKKVYAPNLNVTRNKNLNVKTSKEFTAGRGRGRGDRGKLSDRGGRGRGGRGGLVQTAGLFSEGAGALQVKRAFSGSYRSSSSDAEPGGMRRPTLIKREGKIDLSAENRHMQDLLGDSDDEDFKDEKTDVDFVPIKLNEVKWGANKAENDVKIKNEIKTEEAENDVISEKLNSIKVTPDLIASNRYPTSLEEFFSRRRAQIFLMQLPDSLPCQDADASDEPPSTSQEKSDNTETRVKHSALNSLEEGQIGKLVRYRSGKCKLILGETSFELSLGTETGFQQEAVSISTNREERSGNMVNLGSIEAKVQATPDWDYLFKNCS